MDNILVISNILLWIVVLLNFVLTLALIKRVNNGTQTRKPEFLKTGDKAPDFVAETLHGEKVTLADYNQHELALVFVSPECTPCRKEMPTLNTLYSSAAQVGVQLITVSLADVAATQTFVNEMNFDAPIISAPMGINPFSEKYKVGGTPFYYFIDKDSHIRTGGFLDENWQQLVQRWNGKETPTRHKEVI